MLERLRQDRVRRVRIEFSGAGDSGEVDRVILIRGENLDDHEEVKHRWNDPEGTWASSVHNWAASVASDSMHDWWNNEGGGGVALVDVEAGTVSYRRWEYVTEKRQLPDIDRSL